MITKSMKLEASKLEALDKGAIGVRNVSSKKCSILSSAQSN